MNIIGATDVSVPTFTAGVAAGLLVALLFFLLYPSQISQTDRDFIRRDKGDRACTALVQTVKLISSLIGAVEIISKVPAAAESIKQIGIDIAAMISGKAQHDIDSPLKYVSDNERKRLNELIARYYEVDKFVSGAEGAKKELRYEILVQTCSTLSRATPIRDRIPDYDKLVELFCRSFPPTGLL